MPNSTNSEENVSDAINIRIDGMVLTPVSCASVIAEILKCAVYQKTQIPYHYNMLKEKVDWVRNSESSKPFKRFALEKHFELISDAYDNFESIIENLTNEFNANGCDIEQVLFVFGTSLHCPREVFKIKFDGLTMDHYERNHSQSNIKYHREILRNLFFAQEWLNSVDKRIPLGNTFIMVQKRVKNVNLEDEFLSHVSDYIPPSTDKCLEINLDCKNSAEFSCCNNFVIYEDDSEVLYLENEPCTFVPSVKVLENPGDLKWFQSKIILKGFKPCKAKLWRQ